MTGIATRPGPLPSQLLGIESSRQRPPLAGRVLVICGARKGIRHPHRSPEQIWPKQSTRFWSDIQILKTRKTDVSEPALLRSEYFSNFTAHEFPGAITRDTNSIIGCVYSMSSSAKPFFGDNAKAFELELTTALLSLNPAGIFNEHLETEVLIAPKRAR